jgi:hypothetical protein
MERRGLISVYSTVASTLAAPSSAAAAFFLLSLSFFPTRLTPATFSSPSFVRPVSSLHFFTFFFSLPTSAASTSSTSTPHLRSLIESRSSLRRFLLFPFLSSSAR